MKFDKEVREFIGPLKIKYDRRHKALYDNVNYFIKRFAHHKKMWRDEYSKRDNLETVDYSLIEGGINQLKNNSFCSDRITAKILEMREEYGSWHYGFQYKGVNFHLYFYSKKAPSTKFISKLVTITNVLCDECETRPKKISVLFCDTTFKKRLPKYKSVIGGNEVNTGSTTFTSSDERFICLWRREERIKVYIHELLHALNVESKVIRDALIVEPFMRHFNVDIPILLMGEAYVETWANFLNIISYHTFRKKTVPTEAEIIESFCYEVEFSTYQVAKLLHHFGYRKVSSIYNKNGKFKKQGEWNEDSNVFSYYIIKWGLLSNICKMFELCDKSHRIPCRITSETINNFFDIPLRSWNKRKFTSVINRHILEIIDKKKRYKYIGQSLRMTIHD